MLPINQVILGGTDPLLNTGSLTDQIQYLEEQKRLIEARQKQIQQAANGQQTLQQVSPQQTAKVSVWDLIDAEIEPLTNEQRNMLATNEEYVAINAQYHDYCELFEKWFGKGNFDDMIFESAISFWFDDVDFGEDKLWKYFNELK